MTNRGGKREGAGRKPEPGIAKKVNLRLLPEQWKRIEQIREQSQSMTSVISKLVALGLQSKKGDRANENN